MRPGYRTCVRTVIRPDRGRSACRSRRRLSSCRAVTFAVVGMTREATSSTVGDTPSGTSRSMTAAGLSAKWRRTTLALYSATGPTIRKTSMEVWVRSALMTRRRTGARTWSAETSSNAPGTRPASRSRRSPRRSVCRGIWGHRLWQRADDRRARRAAGECITRSDCASGRGGRTFITRCDGRTKEWPTDGAIRPYPVEQAKGQCRRTSRGAADPLGVGFSLSCPPPAHDLLMDTLIERLVDPMIPASPCVASARSTNAPGARSSLRPKRTPGSSPLQRTGADEALARQP